MRHGRLNKHTTQQPQQLNKALFSETLRDARCSSSGSTDGLPDGPWWWLSHVKSNKISGKKIVLKNEGTKKYQIVSKLYPLLYLLEDLVAIKLCMLSFDSSLIR